MEAKRDRCRAAGGCAVAELACAVISPTEISREERPMCSEIIANATSVAAARAQVTPTRQRETACDQDRRRDRGIGQGTIADLPGAIFTPAVHCARIDELRTDIKGAAGYCTSVAPTRAYDHNGKVARNDGGNRTARRCPVAELTGPVVAPAIHNAVGGYAAGMFLTRTYRREVKPARDNCRCRSAGDRAIAKLAGTVIPPAISRAAGGQPAGVPATGTYRRKREAGGGYERC